MEDGEVVLIMGRYSAAVLKTKQQTEEMFAIGEDL